MFIVLFRSFLAGQGSGIGLGLGRSIGLGIGLGLVVNVCEWKNPNIYILLMPNFQVVYHGISQETLVFSGMHMTL